MSTRSSRRAPSSTVANSQWVKRAGPRSVRVWNDRSRKWELFENVGVSDRAVVEWLWERWAEVGRGNPNRPPDIDTATMRGWEGAGNDFEGMTPAGCLIEGDIDLAEGLITRPIHPDGSTVRIGITRLDAGYLVKCRIQDGDGMTRFEKRFVVPTRKSAGALAMGIATRAADETGYHFPMTVVTADELRALAEEQIRRSNRASAA